MSSALSRRLYIANAGDSRAVLSRQGRAVDLSRDHRPLCSRERIRVEEAGGFFASMDGEGEYLNGQLAVTRALGNWHLQVRRRY